MGEREEEGVGAEGDGRYGVEQEAAQEAGEQAGAERKGERGQGDGEGADEDIEPPRRERVVELRGHGPEQERREEDEGEAEQGIRA